MDTKESPNESQLRTRCAILESQVEVLEEQNKDFRRPLDILLPGRLVSECC